MAGNTVQEFPDPSRTINSNLFSDLTTAVVTNIDWQQPGESDVIYTFDRALTDQEWVACRRRLRSPARETLEIQAQNAITSHNNFLAIASPTQAQTLAQVKVLCRVDKGLIKTEVPDLALLDPTPNA